MEGVQNLKLSLEEIKLATDNFGDKNFIGHGRFGNVYTGKLTISGQQCDVAVKKLDHTMGQGDREFLTEIQMLSSCRHKNLVSLVGFCDEGGEKILVYELVKHGSLDNYLSDTQLSWMQRLQISLGMARGLNYLHNDVGLQHRVVHCDIKSSNILLNENWEAKISDFGLSEVSPSNAKFTSVFTRACGTVGYVDPQYLETEILTKETDVYAVGVVLFEILCGRLAYIERHKDESRFLGLLAQHYYEENRLREIIHPGLMNEMKVDSLDIYTMAAYQCLKKDRRERPNMGWIIEKLEKALEIQACSKVAGFIRFGTWGRQRVGDHWSYELEEGHHLLKITIHYDEVIHSLMFTSESGGVINSSNKIGSWAGADTVSEVAFDWDEEIKTIKGNVSLSRGNAAGHSVISSLSFVTNKRTHGPFGRARGTPFRIPLENCSFAGFYGHAAIYIDSIGVYLKASI